MSRQIENFDEKAQSLKGLIADAVKETSSKSDTWATPIADQLDHVLRNTDALAVLAELLDRAGDPLPFFVEAELGRDSGHGEQLPSHIGPFASEEAAQAYIDSLGPLWGSWSTIRAIAPGGADWKGNRA